MPVRSTYSGDGPRLAVAELVKSPTMIPRIVYSMTNQQFFVDKILRDAGTTDSGAYIYHEGTPLFMDNGAPIVAQGAEIPLAGSSIGNPTAGVVVKRALGIEITEEDRDRNNYDKVNTQLRQLVNTFDRDWNAAFLAAAFAKLPTMASAATATPAAWSTGTTAAPVIKSDLMKAITAISLADADTSNGTGTQKFGFMADTLIINPQTLQSIALSQEYSSIFQGNAADRATLLASSTARLIQIPVAGLDTWITWQMPLNKAIVCQSGIIGGIIDEKPLTTTPMYRINQRQVWRSDTDRRSGVFLDNPKAGLVITAGTSL